MLHLHCALGHNINETHRSKPYVLAYLGASSSPPFLLEGKHFEKHTQTTFNETLDGLVKRVHHPSIGKDALSWTNLILGDSSSSRSSSSSKSPPWSQNVEIKLRAHAESVKRQLVDTVISTLWLPLCMMPPIIQSFFPWSSTAPRYWFVQPANKHLVVAIDLVKSTWQGMSLFDWRSRFGTELKSARDQLESDLQVAQERTQQSNAWFYRLSLTRRWRMTVDRGVQNSFMDLMLTCMHHSHHEDQPLKRSWPGDWFTYALARPRLARQSGRRSVEQDGHLTTPSLAFWGHHLEMALRRNDFPHRTGRWHEISSFWRRELLVDLIAFVARHQPYFPDVDDHAQAVSMPKSRHLKHRKGKSIVHEGKQKQQYTLTSRRHHRHHRPPPGHAQKEVTKQYVLSLYAQVEYCGDEVEGVDTFEGLYRAKNDSMTADDCESLTTMSYLLFVELQRLLHTYESKYDLLKREHPLLSLVATLASGYVPFEVVGFIIPDGHKELQPAEEDAVTRAKVLAAVQRGDDYWDFNATEENKTTKALVCHVYMILVDYNRVLWMIRQGLRVGNWIREQDASSSSWMDFKDIASRIAPYVPPNGSVDKPTLVVENTEYALAQQGTKQQKREMSEVDEERDEQHHVFYSHFEREFDFAEAFTYRSTTLSTKNYNLYHSQTTLYTHACMDSGGDPDGGSGLYRAATGLEEKEETSKMPRAGGEFVVVNYKTGLISAPVHASRSLQLHPSSLFGSASDDLVLVPTRGMQQNRMTAKEEAAMDREVARRPLWAGPQGGPDTFVEEKGGQVPFKERIKRETINHNIYIVTSSPNEPLQETPQSIFLLRTLDGERPLKSSEVLTGGAPISCRKEDWDAFGTTFHAWTRKYNYVYTKYVSIVSKGVEVYQLRVYRK